MSLKEVDTSSTCIFICQLNLWARKCQNFTLPSLSDIYQTHLSCESCFHHMFENWDSNVFSLSYHYSPVLIPDIISGIPKLRRVLLAYSIHNPETEYCQVGLIVLFLPQRFAQKLCKCSSSSFANIIQATVQVFLQILFKQVLLQVLLKQVLLKYCIVANIVEASTVANIVEGSIIQASIVAGFQQNCSHRSPLHEWGGRLLGLGLHCRGQDLQNCSIFVMWNPHYGWLLLVIIVVAVITNLSKCRWWCHRTTTASKWLAPRWTR